MLPHPVLDANRAGGYSVVAADSGDILTGFLAFIGQILWVTNHLRLLVDHLLTGRCHRLGRCRLTKGNMARYVALLQGINVGKHKRIAMSDLKTLMEGLGHTEVKTYLNSGNIVFTSDQRLNEELADELEAAISSTLGLEVPVVVRSDEEMRAIVAGNPFPEAAADHKALHVAFFDRELDPEHLAALAVVERGDDDYRIVGPNVYLHYPNYLTGATFMPNGLGKAQGVVSTSRNWRTVTRLAEMST